ncbi:hypothetical protein [Flavobacterium hydatis]|uniref:Uncharacterized protein n=1 Tax=Flavobacterium hydatis TaxID=991 RepID=A0A086A041_FLAHY|nr:hypothetical protein [Flavobacterium hydatis]KFF10055.1 hypothetical protein IW20_21510 [Flavobacterium hydatis]OXA93312.1 hypothetical protein B0A62_13780 [Flavobacterium hydatis]
MNKLQFFLMISFLLLISCKDEKKTVKNEQNINAEISIIFPDTVYVNELYDGKINYKDDLDTITTSFDDIKNIRYVYFTYLKNQDINYGDESLKKIVTDTFGARNNRLIPLYDIRFDKLGLNYIDGLIIDEVMIENGAKVKNGEPMDRIITHEFRVTKKVVVIEEKDKK